MLVYYFVPFIVSNHYLLFWVSNGHNSVTVQNRTHVYVNFFHHKDLGNHLLQLCPKVVKRPVYVFSMYSSVMSCHQVNFTRCIVTISILQIIAAGFCDTKQHGVTSQTAITLILTIISSCLVHFQFLASFRFVMYGYCFIIHINRQRKNICLIKFPYNRHMFCKEDHFKK